ncbi:MAG: Rpn family recombination-promoting nuclease/putative transposase [Magnetococcales bacterium]|nr:Rpn family recombination-promoting nuclease/putative transposase [Magnetococcales bacterium]NGZ25502.1 Rpn family recombination-promoting nuclease/putative transposase [Magnetococcales bacterium]
MPRPARDTDSIYHLLFSYPKMVADLLQAFMDAQLLALLDLEKMRRHNSKFTARQGERRRSDVVWEIPTRQGGSVFIILMLEFQSGIEEWMVLRYGGYAFLLYQQLVDERKLKAADGLPPILPILLYNGEPRWDAATQVQTMIRLPAGSSLWNFQPGMGYYVMDEGSYPKEMLEASPYLSAILFRMEHPTDPEGMVRAAQDAAAWFAKHPDGPPVKHLFRELLLAGLTRLKVETPHVVPENFQEVVIMLAARVEKWAMEYERKGKLKGKLEGRAEMLFEQLQDRFGAVPDWVRTKLSEADLDTLKGWSKKIFGAEKIEQIFQ